MEQPLNGFEFHFLGTFAVSYAGQPIEGFRTDKERALLAYLALEGSQPVNRHVLAGLLWPDMRESNALANLRQALFRLRHTLGHGGGEEVLGSSRHSLQFRAPTEAVDALAFQELIAGSEVHQHETFHGCATCVLRLAGAARLYRGELLAGISIPTAPYFEEWLLLRREMAHLQAVRTLTVLALSSEQNGDLPQANHWATRLVYLDPYREQSHRLLMRILARQGLPEQSLAQFGICRQLLRDELDAEPDPETVALMERIRRGDFQTRSDPGAAQPTSGLAPTSSLVPVPARPLMAGDADESLREVPLAGPFFGRSQERITLSRWLTNDGPEGECSVIAILGMGGVGKTALAAQCLRSILHKNGGSEFDLVLWRSLLNAPPLGELLPAILQTLSGQRLADMPSAIGEQLRMLFGFMQQRRVLLVLDNLESILEEEEAGQFRQGYESYRQLIEWTATHFNNSLLLFTSRVRPVGFSRLEGDHLRVRSLRLHGLDEAAGRALLAHKGIQTLQLPEIDRDVMELVRRCSGNPLALKLAADTIDTVFGGDIAEFLGEHSLVFDDVRAVLDQQFKRLSELEQEILFWLAVEREAAPVSDLRRNLFTPVSQRALVEALRVLQRRSLIERNETGFLLQNVIIEYLSDRLVEAVGHELTDGAPYLLHRVTLQKALAKEAVRQSQARLLLMPVAERMVARFGRKGLAERSQQFLDNLRDERPGLPSYAGGNILNLLLYLQMDLTGFDFSRIDIRQVHLRNAMLRNVNFAEARFDQMAIADRFGDIRSLVFSPGATIVAAGTASGEVSLWRTADAQLIAVLNDDAAPIWSVAFSPDGAVLATGGTDYVIRLWDVQNAKLLTKLAGHTKTVRCVAFGTDGATLASGGDDRTVRLWDLPSGRLRRTLQGAHAHSVRSIAFSPTREVLASGSDDHAVVLWSLDTGQVERTLLGHDGWVMSVAFSPDGRDLASCGYDGKVILWNAGTGHIRHILDGHIGWVESVAFSPDGKTLASGGDDCTVRLWDASAGTLRYTLLGHSNRVNTVAFSPDGGLLASGDEDRNLYLWDARIRQPRHRLSGHLLSVESIAFSRDGDVLASGSRDNTIRFWRLVADEITKMPRYVPEGRPVFIGHVVVVDLSPDGELLGSGNAHGAIHLVDVLDGRVRRTLPGHDGMVKSISFGPKGSILASGGTDETIRLWDVEGGRMIHALTGHSGWVNALAFSPDGRQLASAGADEVVCLWDVQSGRLLDTYAGHVGWVNDVVYSPDGTLLVTAGADGTVRLWDTDGGRSIQTLAAHDGWVWKVAMTDDGRTLASGSHDRTVALWDIANVPDPDAEMDGRNVNAALRTKLAGHAPWVTDIAINSQARILASSSGDQTIRLWQIDTGEPIQTLQIPGPYEGMTITGATGLTEAQRAALRALGAVE